MAEVQKSKPVYIKHPESDLHPPVNYRFCGGYNSNSSGEGLHTDDSHPRNIHYYTNIMGLKRQRL